MIENALKDENSSLELPDEFYTTEKMNRETYTLTPTGKISIQQLIQGVSEYWVAGEQLSKKKKKLILFNYSELIYYGLENSISNNWFDIIRILLDSHFEIYGFNSPSVPLQRILRDTYINDICKLNHLDDENHLEHITDATMKCAEEGFSKDDILILNEALKSIKTHESFNFNCSASVGNRYTTNDPNCYDFISQIPENQAKHLLCLDINTIHTLSKEKKIYNDEKNPPLFLKLDALYLRTEIPLQYLLKIVAQMPNLRHIVIDKFSWDLDNEYDLNLILSDPKCAHIKKLISKEDQEFLKSKAKPDPTLDITDMFYYSMRSNATTPKTESGPPPDTSNYKSTTSLGDVDTTPYNLTHSAKKVFYEKKGFSEIPVNSYRMQIFTKLRFSSEASIGINQVAYEKVRDIPNLVPIKPLLCEKSPGALIVKRDKSVNCYYGNCELSSDQDWQSLPSISSREKITSFYIEGGAHNVEFSYSESENLYYVKNKTGRRLEFHFNVEVPQSQTDILPVGIKELILEVQGYRAAALKTEEGKAYTGEPLLKQLIEQRVGSCRHRTVAFKYLMAQQFPDFPVRMIFNQVHAYVEIQHNGQWISCDLGGYPGKLIIEAKSEAIPTLNTELSVSDPASSDQASSDLSESQELNPFMRWDKPVIETDSVKDFNLKTIAHSEGKNVLVELPAYKTLDYQYALQATCKNTSKPVYVINSPKDLVCSSNWIERRKDNSGQLRQGPGGPLYDFLKENDESSPVLIVNWNNFSPEEIAKFNTIIDKKRFADGVALPPNTHVVGIYDTSSKNAYQGSDFYSRFSAQLPFPDTLSLERADTLKFQDLDQISKETVTIDLYGSHQWQSLLQGRWVMSGNQLNYQEGPFIVAIRDKKPIHILNPPDSESFHLFVQKLLLDPSIPRESIPTMQYKTNWEIKNEQVKWESVHELAKLFTLNAISFYSFLSDFDVKSNQIYEKPGWLEQNAGKTIPIEITGHLSEAQWSQLLDEAAKWKVILQIHPKENLELPKNMIGPSKDALHTASPLRYSNVFLSSDPGFVAAQLKEKNPNAEIIDISECIPSDILIKIDYDLERFQKDRQFYFDEKKSDILKRLEQGQDFILKGSLSTELLDTLAPLLLGQKQYLGNLSIVTDLADTIALIPHQIIHPTNEDKIRALNATHSMELIKKLTQNDIEKHNIAQLDVVLKFLKENPERTPSEAWSEFYDLPTTSPHEIIDLSLEASEAFENARVQQINDALLKEPYVFISGPTGAGKSTFIHEVLKKHNIVVYNEETEIEKWATDTSDQPKILFIDEANIGHLNYTKFDKLFENPPQILVGQKLLTLTPTHRVIFAGNPANYGGRNLPSLFKDHDNAIVFETMPPAYIYHNILKPIFDENKIDNALQKQILLIFLSTYNKIKEMNPDSILMSPRELQMMSLLTLSMDNPDDYLAKAYEVAHEISAKVLPKEKQAEFKNWFNQTFLNIPVLTLPPFEESLGDFILTPSRHKAYCQIEDLLRVRDYQKKCSDPNAQYGGFGGLVFEAEPGVGKSDFVSKMLLKHNFHEAKLSSPEARPEENRFYRIPPSLSNAEKEAILLKAFHEGAIVVIDELNSAGLLEKTMNSLLTGRDLAGNRPLRPGFKIIGTENPITYEGRKARSLALQRRLMSGTFSDYLPYELSDILVGMGFSEKKAIKMVSQYIQAREFALANHKKPLPSPRTLFDRAKFLVNHSKPLPIVRLAKLAGNLKMSDFTSDNSMQRTLELINKYAEKLPDELLFNKNLMHLCYTICFKLSLKTHFPAQPLAFAIKNNYVGIIRILTENGYFKNPYFHDVDAVLLPAIKSGDVAPCRLFFNHGFKFNIQEINNLLKDEKLQAVLNNDNEIKAVLHDAIDFSLKEILSKAMNDAIHKESPQHKRRGKFFSLNENDAQCIKLIQNAKTIEELMEVQNRFQVLDNHEIYSNQILDVVKTFLSRFEENISLSSDSLKSRFER
jgi:hypothetical protein